MEASPHGDIGHGQTIPDEPCAALEVVIQHRGEPAEPAEGLLDGGPIRASQAEAELDDVIFMSQRLWDSPAGPTVCRDFWTTAYQASMTDLIFGGAVDPEESRSTRS